MIYAQINNAKTERHIAESHSLSSDFLFSSFHQSPQLPSSSYPFLLKFISLSLSLSISFSSSLSLSYLHAHMSHSHLHMMLEMAPLSYGSSVNNGSTVLTAIQRGAVTEQLMAEVRLWRWKRRTETTWTGFKASWQQTDKTPKEDKTLLVHLLRRTRCI